MKTRIAAIAVAAVLALTLTGCGEDETPDAQPQAFAQTTQEAPATDAPDEPAPLVAETPASGDAVKKDAEAAYLKFLHDHPRQGTAIPNATDEQRLSAGYEICERRAAGEEGSDISVVEGEQRNPDSGYYLDSFDMYSAGAISGLCD